MQHTKLWSESIVYVSLVCSWVPASDESIKVAKMIIFVCEMLAQLIRSQNAS